MSARSNRLIAACLGAAGLVGAAGLGWGMSGAIEARNAERLGALVQAAGLGWVAVSVDGTVVTLGGEAPDLTAALAAIETARAAGVHLRLTDRMTVAPGRPAPPAQTAGFALDVLRDEHGVAVGGLAPNAAVRASLAEGLAALGLGAAPADFALDAGADTPARWEAMQAAALAAARSLLHGRITLTAEGMTVTGLPRNAIGRAAIERHAGRLREEGLVATLDLVATPGRAVEPYTFVAETAAGRLRIVDCTAPDAAAGARVEAAARSLSAGRGPRCRVAPGPPHGEWTEAAIAALTVLAEAPSARLEIEGLQVRLVPAPDTIGTAFDAAAARLQASLPLGFGLVAAPADGPNGDAAAAATAWVRARLDDGHLTMTGFVPDAATRAALVSYAAARFGADRIGDSIGVVETKAPEGWRAAVLAGIDGLAVLDRGESFVRDGRIRIWGATRKALAAREAQAALASVTAAGWTGTTRITVDLPARVAALKLGPEPCIETLSAQVASSPIQFDPGSARIDRESQAVLDALAETLGRCAALSIVIEGHTDSQGSAAYNNRLSEARAGAVRAALIERGGFEATLRAVGFGPSRPIADNRTEAGRALNRRIAFRVTEADPAPAAMAEPSPAAEQPRPPAARPPAARPEVQR